MTQPQTPPTAASPERIQQARVGVSYAIDGDLRFLSHHDEMRLLVRALTRAAWPLAYSQGFNPKPRIVLPLPRSTGMSSACQLALVDLATEANTARLQESLSAQLPRGAALERVFAFPRRVCPQARRVRYEVSLPPGTGDAVRLGIRSALAAKNLPIQRDTGPDSPARPVDLRGYIDILEFDGQMLHMNLLVENQQSARPLEVLSVLNLPVESDAASVRRAHIQWNIALHEAASRLSSAERKPLDHEENHREQTHATSAHEENQEARA